VKDLRATEPSLVIEELRANLPENTSPGDPGSDPDYVRLLNELADELTLFWQLTVAPAWPRIMQCLESEVVYRSRLLAFGGAAAVFTGLHDDVSFVPRGDGGSVNVRTGRGPHQRISMEGLLLVPSVFAWPDVYAVARGPWRPTLAFPARGIAELWPSREPRLPAANEELAALVGAPRARVLRLLTRARTTSELASALGSSPPTISQHVTTLCAAGFLNRARIGRRVLYSLSERGQAVLRAVDQPSGDDGRGDPD